MGNTSDIFDKNVHGRPKRLVMSLTESYEKKRLKLNSIDAYMRWHNEIKPHFNIG